MGRTGEYYLDEVILHRNILFILLAIVTIVAVVSCVMNDTYLNEIKQKDEYIVQIENELEIYKSNNLDLVQRIEDAKNTGIWEE